MKSAAQWIVFVVCVLLFVPGPFNKTFSEVERYGYLADIMPGDWLATNIWLDSTDCTLQRGVWLAVCENGRMIPISERALADDPGHALLLEMWSAATGRRATLVDAARLSTLLNVVGLVTLAGLLFQLRAWLASVALLVLGPAEYLFWMGTSPHWSYIGVVSLAAVLPLALLAQAEGLLERRAAAVWIGTGLFFLAVAALVRESIGIMGFVLALVSLGWSGIKAPRSMAKTVGLLFIAGVALLAFAAPRWTVAARDAAFDMVPAERLQRHGLTHTLYLGLGFIENKFGIRYDDAYGEEVARRWGEAHGREIVAYSPEYFSLMGTLYRELLFQDPLEVARIYAEKIWIMLARPTIYPGPALWVVLAIGLVHFLAATALGTWRRIGFVQGFVVEAVALGFLGLFVAQAMVALPSHMYAVPVTAFVLVLLGIFVESVLRALWASMNKPAPG
jgi:hypothetical protein